MISAATNPDPGPRTFDRLVRSEYFVLWLSVLYVAILAPFTPGLVSAANFGSILTTLLPLLLLAVGQTFVLVSGGIDLSVTSTVAIASVVGGLAVNQDNGWLGVGASATPLAVGLMLLTGVGVGLLNGGAIVRFQMPPFIVTLTTMMFFSGLAIWLTKSKGIGNLPHTFTAIGGRTGIALGLTAAVAWLAHLLLSRTLYGRWLYAVGHNRRTAEISGVPTGFVTVAAYGLSGAFAAVAAVVLTGQAETATPTLLGQRMLLDIIAAAVIGGVSLFGGKGTILWACLGVLFIKLLDNSLNLLGLTFFVILMAKGGVILLAAWLDAWRNPGVK